MKMMNKYDRKIELMVISKIATARLDIREKFRDRHKVAHPDLQEKMILGKIEELRTWSRLCDVLDNKTNLLSLRTDMLKTI